MPVTIPLAVIAAALAAVALDRAGAARLPDRTPVYMLRYPDRWAAYPGITNQPANADGPSRTAEVNARWAQHADRRTWNPRASTWKAGVDYQASTIVRWCWSPAHAARVERRLILGMSALFRAGRVVGLPARFLGNVQHHRRGRSTLERGLFLWWGVWYGLLGEVFRGGRFLVPWAPGGVSS